MALVGFNTIKTHSMREITESDLINKTEEVEKGARLFEGLLSGEVLDKQNEVTVRDELLKAMPTWMKRGSPISDSHTSRIVGKGLGFHKAEVKSGDHVIPAIKIQAKIFEDNKVDDMVWNKIKSGEYKGFSYGGLTTSAKEPVRHQDGSLSYMLKDLSVWEVAVCGVPSCPIALITDYNKIAKSYSAQEMNEMAIDVREVDDKNQVVIKCDRNVCYVQKSEANNLINKEKDESDMPKHEDERDEDKEEMEKSINSLENSVEKTVNLIASAVEKQTSFNEMIKAKFDVLEDRLAKMDEEEEGEEYGNGKNGKNGKDEEPEEEKKFAPAVAAAGVHAARGVKALVDDDDEEKEKADDGKGLKVGNNSKVTLPDKDVDAHKVSSSQKPKGDASADTVTIEQKDAESIAALKKKYPNLFVDEVKKSDEVVKTFTPRWNELRPDADSIIEKSNMDNEFTALMKAGGDPSIAQKIRQQMMDGTFGNLQETGLGTARVNY